MNLLTKIVGTLRDIARHPLSRRSAFRACCRYMTSQVACRLVPGDVALTFPNGIQLLVSPHMKGAATFIMPGLCEFEAMGFLMHYLRPQDIFIDVGANVGAYTLLAAGVSGSRVIAFEPGTVPFRYLSKNIRLNGLDTMVTLRNEALGAEQGEIELTDDLGTENYVRPQGHAGRTCTVKMTTMDSALAAVDPTFIKMDVEGFETSVCSGARRTLAKHSLEVIVIERDGHGARYGFDEQALHEQIKGLSFKACGYDPFQRKLWPLEGDMRGNLIYIKDFESASRRLRAAPAFRFADFEI